MKRMYLSIVFLLCFSFALNGCKSNQRETYYDNEHDNNYQTAYGDGYAEGYNVGYNEGYDYGFEDGINEDRYKEKYLEFQSTVITLMYDYEYETVEKLFEYYPEAVGVFLEDEFGTTDISTIIDYLESERTLYPDTIVGKCKYCGEDVCHKDAIHWVNIYDLDDQGLAHRNCYDDNNPS